MKAQPDVNAKDANGVSTLHLAARKEREYCARLLIAAGVDLNARDNSMKTPLHVSVFGKSTKIMKLLLEAGCDAGALNDKGFSVLHIAALSGTKRPFRNCGMAGVEADGKDTMGLTPEEVADTWGSHGTAWLCVRCLKGRGPTLLHSLIVSHHVEDIHVGQGRLTYLLKANSPVNRDPHYQDPAGLTPMHWAAKLGLTATARALISACCSYPGVVSYADDTPAQLAERAGHNMLAQETVGNDGDDGGSRLLTAGQRSFAMIFLNVVQVEQNHVRPEDSELRSGMDHLLNCLRGKTPWQTTWPFREQALQRLDKPLGGAASNNCPLTATFLKLCGLRPVQKTIFFLFLYPPARFPMLFDLEKSKITTIISQNVRNLCLMKHEVLFYTRFLKRQFRSILMFVFAYFFTNKWA
ncbi:Serine/threonine-protein phosphatase 6 regulatory ankyrin repeat subunit C [Chionoecetes opilio]|uniref:Serine/threonine-protein phosphatase 6 regulatory ankyrin repeat subunit C n=1 Tax=Chionoecetes opilio TaxID=41210 RepID=A0A8J4YRW1_CHIOP|nr:Serine/threonine-protein phosphatase 6 regulatory ankyrin repeat subunit C [Chionoecetes opilio]